MPGMRYGFLIPLSKMDMGSSGWRLPHTTPWVLERGVQEASHYCIGTIFTYLHGAWLTLCPFWVRRLNISQRTFPCWDGIDCGCWFEHLKKLDCGYDKHNCCSSVIYFEFWIRNQPFHRLNDSNLSALQRLFRSSDWFDLKSRWEISKIYIILIPKTFLWIRNQPFHRLNDSNLSALQRLFRSSDWFDLKSRWEISKIYIILIPKTFLWIRNQPFHRLNDSNLSALQRLFRSSDWFDLKSRWEISKSYIILIPKTFLWYDDYFLSNFCFVICHLTGKCPRSFFLSFFLGFRRSNLITGLSRWRTPD